MGTVDNSTPLPNPSPFKKMERGKQGVRCIHPAPTQVGAPLKRGIYKDKQIKKPLVFFFIEKVLTTPLMIVE